ncbi:hypothetical protein [Methylobacterium crusticola]|nr:hypothetical protein [Methylobacterium crusticola]
MPSPRSSAAARPATIAAATHGYGAGWMRLPRPANDNRRPARRSRALLLGSWLAGLAALSALLWRTGGF